MELLESIAKIVHTNNPSDDKERYWRLLVKLFLVDRSEGLLLSSLPDYFKKYYDRQIPYNGKFPLQSKLVQILSFGFRQTFRSCARTCVQSNMLYDNNTIKHMDQAFRFSHPHSSCSAKYC